MSEAGDEDRRRVPGGEVLRLLGQPSVRDGHSADENQVSRRRDPGVAFDHRNVDTRSVLALHDRVAVRLAVTTRNAVPHQRLARDAPVVGCSPIHGEDVFSQCRGTKARVGAGMYRASHWRSSSGASETAVSAGSASGAIFTNHCTERWGSTGVWQR